MLATQRLTRRGWITAAAATVGAACGRKKGTGYRGYALIATSGENSVAVVDLTAFQALKPIPVEAPPSAVVPNERQLLTYALTPSTGRVYAVDAGLQIVRSTKLASEVSAIRVSPDGTRLLAISAAKRELIEADAISLQVVRRHSLAGEPVSLDVARGPYAVVSTGAQGLIELVDLRSGQHWHAELPGHIGTVRFRADGQRLLVANLNVPGLTAFNVPSLETIADLPLAMRPDNLCFNSDAGQLFVSGEGMDGVAIVFPYNPLIVEQTVLAGRDPGVMACSAEPPYLFVGSNSGSDVCVLNIDTRKVIGLVDVGQRPTYITTTPDNQYALVLDRDAGAMAIIHIPAIRVTPAMVRSKSGVSLFTLLDVGPGPVHAAVVPGRA